MIEGLTTLFSGVAFPVGVCIVLFAFIYKYIEKVDAANREDTNRLIQKQDERINHLIQENKEDKEIFKEAIHSFNDSVREFKSVNNEIKTIKEDLTEIKCKISQ